jgi:hypothetical protein
MVDAGIEDLSTDPIAVLGRVAERFRLDLTDEQVCNCVFMKLLTSCSCALLEAAVKHAKAAVIRRHNSAHESHVS